MHRSFLFLQGPHGPFFKRLGQQLHRLGHQVLRVNLNGGDWIDWSGPLTLDYTGDHLIWPGYAKDLMTRQQITDLVVYGDCRSAHQDAIRIARSLGIRVHAFEEGYIRPRWVTLEEDGVNGYSPLPKDPAWFKEQAALLEEPPEVDSFGPSMRWMLLYCVRYYLAKTLLSHRFRQYIRHRPYRPSQELLLWLQNLCRLPVLRWRSHRRLAAIRQSKAPYYLVGLQLDADAQIREHSTFLSGAEFLNRVLRSFAAHAPENSLLVIKKHPLDPSGVPYETLAMLESYALGIRERVVFLHTGSLPELIRDAQGVVVVNSTVGTSSLHHGVPTIALGEAVYDMEGLTWQQGLDRFWREGTPPDRALFAAFRRVLLNRVLLYGGFFAPKGRHLLLPEALRHLTTTAKAEEGKPQQGKVVPFRKVNGL